MTRNSLDQSISESDFCLFALNKQNTIHKIGLFLNKSNSYTLEIKAEKDFSNTGIELLGQNDFNVEYQFTRSQSIPIKNQEKIYLKVTRFLEQEKSTEFEENKAYFVKIYETDSKDLTKTTTFTSKTSTMTPSTKGQITWKTCTIYKEFVMTYLDCWSTGKIFWSCIRTCWSTTNFKLTRDFFPGLNVEYIQTAYGCF